MMNRMFAGGGSGGAYPVNVGSATGY